MGRIPQERDGRELQERVVEINRVAKVVKGGRRFSFTALVVVGDEVDQVGIGYGKAKEVPVAIQKAVEDAKKNMFKVPKHDNTITHEVLGVFGAGRVLLKPGLARYRRHRRRRRARGAGARGPARRAGEVARHVQPHQPLPCDRDGPAQPAPAGGRRQAAGQARGRDPAAPRPAPPQPEAETVEVAV